MYRRDEGDNDDDYNNNNNRHIDRCGDTLRKKYRAKGSRRRAKIQEFMYRDVTNVESESGVFNTLKTEDCL
jgi:hypothetical protein